MQTDIMGESNGEEMVLRPVKIVREDGTIEVVYISDKSQEEAHKKIQQKFWMIYMSVSLLALLLTGYFTYLQIKASKN
jgi:hypothetical protein